MKTVAAIAQRLSPRAEFFTIVSICLGYPIAGSLLSMLKVADRSGINFTSSTLLMIMVFEIASLFVAGSILSCRGWRIDDLNFETTWKLTGAGLLLFAIYYGGYPYIFFIFGELTGSTQSMIDTASRFTANAPASIFIMVSMINAFFEEIVVVGYVTRALEKNGAIYVIAASTLLRFAYHTYQGQLAIVSILPLAVLFTSVYWRFRRLWPLIFAHFLLDAISFMQSQA